MHARAPNAFLLSLFLHAGVVLAIASLAFVVQHNEPAHAQIFELVAGPPTDPMATEAPALGSEDGQVEVKVNEKRVREERAWIPPAPSERQETKPASKDPAKTGPKITYKDFVAKHPRQASSKSAASGDAKAPRLKTRGISEGVVGGSSRSHGGGGGKALTAAEHSAMEAYTSRLEAALHQNLQPPPGLPDLLSAEIGCTIAADGTISNIHVERSSGNPEYDQSCVEAFMRVGSIGPRPDGESDTWTIRMHIDPE